MPHQAFIFDLDGVITNSKEAYSYAYLKTAEKYGFDLDRKLLEKVLEKNRPGIIQQLYPKLSDGTISHLKKGLKNVLSKPQSVKKVVLIRDGLELAYSLKNRGLPIAVVTDSHPDFVSEVFHRLGIPEIFDYVLPKEKATNSKEDRFRYLFDRWKIFPDRILYIGDTVRDVELARKVGTKVAIIYNKTSWSWPVKTGIVEAQPDYIFDNAKQVLDIIPFV